MPWNTTTFCCHPPTWSFHPIISNPQKITVIHSIRWPLVVLCAVARPFASSAVFFQFLLAVLVSRRAFLHAFASDRFVSGAFSCREKTRRTVFLILNFGFLALLWEFWILQFDYWIDGCLCVRIFCVLFSINLRTLSIRAIGIERQFMHACII